MIVNELVDGIYPWQQEVYTRILSLQARSTILLYGSPMKHLRQLTSAITKSILCLSPQDNHAYCGKCTSCKLFEINNHPDYVIIGSTNTESIREMLQIVGLSASISSIRVVAIENISLLNNNSANALLKILEDTPSQTLFILNNHSLNKILPTILSRCQKFKVSHRINNTDSQQNFWYHFNDQDPIGDSLLVDNDTDIILETLVTPSIDNIFKLSSHAKSISHDIALEFIHKWLHDLLCLNMCTQVKYFPSMIDKIKPLSQRCHIKRALHLAGCVNKIIQYAHHPLNHKLQLENILFQYQQIFS